MTVKAKVPVPLILIIIAGCMLMFSHRSLAKQIGMSKGKSSCFESHVFS